MSETVQMNSHEVNDLKVYGIEKQPIAYPHIFFGVWYVPFTDECVGTFSEADKSRLMTPQKKVLYTFSDHSPRTGKVVNFVFAYRYKHAPELFWVISDTSKLEAAWNRRITVENLKGKAISGTFTAIAMPAFLTLGLLFGPSLSKIFIKGAWDFNQNGPHVRFPGKSEMLSFIQARS